MSGPADVPGSWFAVHVKKERFKFNCAHFVAFEGFRERLHGHNYQVGITLRGRRGADGYVVDFGDVKEHVMRICKRWNEHFILPTRSDVIQVDSESDAEQVSLLCQDGARFQFPKGDCLFLPIVHSTAEELAELFAQLLVESISPAFLQDRGVTHVDVSVAEAPNQEAIFSTTLDALVQAVEGRKSGTPPPAPPAPVGRTCLSNAHQA